MPDFGSFPSLPELLAAWQINEAIQGFDLERIAQNDRRLGIRLAEVIVNATSAVI